MISLKIKRAAEEIVRKLDLGLGVDGIRENERRIEEILARHFAEPPEQTFSDLAAGSHDRGHTQAP